MWVMDATLKVRISSELLDQVRAKGKAEERSLSAAVRFALRQYVTEQRVEE